MNNADRIERNAAMADFIKAGGDIRDAASRFGLHTRQARAIAGEYAVERSRKLIEQRNRDICAALESGADIVDLADKHNRSSSTIYEIARAGGVPSAHRRDKSFRGRMKLVADLIRRECGGKKILQSGLAKKHGVSEAMITKMMVSMKSDGVFDAVNQCKKMK